MEQFFALLDQILINTATNLLTEILLIIANGKNITSKGSDTTQRSDEKER